jgi:hypothetical protein
LNPAFPIFVIFLCALDILLAAPNTPITWKLATSVCSLFFLHVTAASVVAYRQTQVKRGRGITDDPHRIVWFGIAITLSFGIAIAGAVEDLPEIINYFFGRLGVMTSLLALYSFCLVYLQVRPEKQPPVCDPNQLYV